MRKVLLTDAMQDVLDDIAFALGDHFQVRTCCDAAVLAQTVEQYEPELLLLDLSIPNYDPFALLRKIQNKRVSVIAVALDANDYLARLLDELGVRWLIVKPLRAEMVATRLLELELELDDPPDRAIRRAVYSALQEVGVRLFYQGYMTLAEGIVYACTHEDCSMTDELYPYVAQVCGGTVASVEKAMSRCIEQAFRRRRAAVWEALFGATERTKCPTNSKFIKHLAHTARKQIR